MRPDIILLSSTEWKLFHEACEKAGVPTTHIYYWAWRMKDPIFKDKNKA